MAGEKKSSTRVEREDRRILRVFSALVVLMFSGVIIYEVMTGIDFIQMVNSLLGSLTFAFFFTGLLAFKYYRKKGRIGFKKIAKWSVSISVLCGVVVTILYYLVIIHLEWYTLDVPFGTGVTLVGVFLLFLFIFYVTIGVVIIEGFGLIGVYSSLGRKYIPSLLNDIESMTENEGKGLDIQTELVRWIFSIPDVLDTGTLKLTWKVKKTFPWKYLKEAFIWEILFALIFAVNIGLNPLLLETFSLEQTFALVSSVSEVIPLIVIPWFILQDLGAEIKGPVKDYELYKGLKFRMYSVLVTLSTLIVFVRLALRSTPITDFAFFFTTYFVGFLISSFIFTFIHFNYFEGSLTRYIYKRYKGKKE